MGNVADSEELLGKLENIKKEIRRVEKGMIDDPVGRDFVNPEVRMKTKFTEHLKKEMRQLKFAADLLGRKTKELRERLVNQQNCMKFIIDVKSTGSTRLLGLAYLTGDSDAIVRNRNRVVGKGNQHEELRKRQRQAVIDEIDGIVKKNDDFNKGYVRSKKKEEMFNKLELNRNYLLEQIQKDKIEAFVEEANQFDFNNVKPAKFGSLKVIFTFALSAVHIRNHPKKTKAKIRLFLMRKFIKNYENYDKQLKETLFKVIRVPYLAILNFDDIDFDLTNPKTPPKKAQKMYLKLEVAL